MHYSKMGVPCTENGVPICHLDQVVCNVRRCHYYFPYKETGNCVLRADKHDNCTLETFAKVWRVSRQRVDQMEKNALRKIRKWHGKEVMELLEACAKVSIEHNAPPVRNHKVMAIIRSGRLG